MDGGGRELGIEVGDGFVRLDDGFERRGDLLGSESDPVY